jgi:hypothetical protein
MARQSQSLDNILQFQRSSLSTEKNSIIRALVDNCTEYVKLVCGNDELLHQFVKEALFRYSLSFKFNVIMSMASRVKGSYEKTFLNENDTQVHLFRKIIMEEWNKQSLDILLYCRLLTSIVSLNTTFPYDITVYRGVDQRQKRLGKVTYLTNLKKVRELEDFISPRINNKAMIPVVVHTLLEKKVSKEELRDTFFEYPFISSDAESEVLHFVESLSMTLNDLADDSVGILEKLSIGERYVCNSFMSTSLMKSHSQKFYEPEHCCFLEIFIPAHTPMLYISPFGNFTYDARGDYDISKDEFEILLPPGATFTVRSNKDNYVRLYYQGCKTLDENLHELARQWDIINQARELQDEILEQSFDHLVSVME